MKHNFKTKAVLVAGGVLAGLASLVPMTTYAIDNPATATVTAKINPYITIDAASGGSTQGDAGKILTTSISATVTTNSKYTIAVKTATSETAMKAEGVTEGIPASANVAENVSAWAIKAKNADGTEDDVYTAMKATDTTLYTSNAGAVSAAKTDFTVGISTAPSITAGSYSVNLIITAANV